MTEELSWADVGTVALLAAGTTAVVGAAGVALVRASGHRTLRLLVPAVAVLTMLAVVAGLVGASAAMFLSAHDLQVVLVVAVVAGLLGVGLAALLAGTVLRGTSQLVDAARTLGDGGTPSVQPPPPTRELAAVATELERAGERLADAREREATLEASRRELVSWVSHDLRTPLAGLRAMAEALEDGMADEPARYHRQMRREVDRLSGLVDDLFELSRIQSGALDLSVGEVSLPDLVTQTVSDADALARSRGVHVEGDAGALAVRADAQELSRAMANLVVNAIRHTPHDGTVVVRAERVGDEAVLSVADACGGIPDADLARLFETGYRGESSRTPGPDAGGGIGLAIVAGIVAAHHGTVEVANHGPGCRFEIRLPLG